jgi:transforming growth factor-beta-induced protein
MAKKINATSLRSTLGSLEDITVFAPRDAGFDANRSMLAGLSLEQLTGVLSYHVVKGIHYSTKLRDNQTLPTIQGGSLKVKVSTNGTIFVNNASVNQTDFLTKNGVLHTIDSILVP